MSVRPWAIRGLLLVVLAAPLTLLALPDRRAPKRETDLVRVYDLLPKWCGYADLGKWCGLRVREATATEATYLRGAAESAADPKAVWLPCHPISDRIRESSPGKYRSSIRIEWHRISHPTDRSQWIGIGVYEQYNTGGTSYLILCRVAVGLTSHV